MRKTLEEIRRELIISNDPVARFLQEVKRFDRMKLRLNPKYVKKNKELIDSIDAYEHEWRKELCVLEVNAMLKRQKLPGTDKAGSMKMWGLKELHGRNHTCDIPNWERKFG